MAKKVKYIGEWIDDVSAAVNVGNGSVQIMTNHARDIIQFEPIIAPISHKRALEKVDEKPEFSLRVNDDLLVFGAHDVMMHGQMELKRRRNSLDRYTAADYYYMLAVLMLKGFASFRGASAVLRPHMIVTVPNSVYNDAEAMGMMESVLFTNGVETFVDYDGCELRVKFEKDRVKIRPEAAFDLFHWAYGSGEKALNSMSGAILIWDIGYLTAQSSVFVNGKYQRDMSHTFSELGFHAVVDRVKEWIEKSGRKIDASWLDLKMRDIAGFAVGAVKRVEVAPGVFMDIAPAYDSAIEYLVNVHIDTLHTKYQQRLAKGIVSGGGMYHMGRYLNEHLPVDNTHIMPDPEVAGVAGAYQTQRRSLGW